MKHEHFDCAFAVVTDGVIIWATTRDGKDTGRIGLPGGKREEFEDCAISVAIRESLEEGLIVSGNPAIVHRDTVDGLSIVWVRFDNASSVSCYKEQHRGIKPVSVSIDTIIGSGYGNEWIVKFKS